jgi:hypothetical protein
MYELYYLRPIPSMPENHPSPEKKIMCSGLQRGMTLKAVYLEKFTAEFETDLGVNQETR